MTCGLSKDIRDHVWTQSFLWLQITREDIKEQVTWAVNLVIADGHFRLP